MNQIQRSPIDSNSLRAKSDGVVFFTSVRHATDLASGFMSAEAAKALFEPASFSITGGGNFCCEDLRLGRELPLYEVAYKDKVYRALVRKPSGENASMGLELIRTWALGVTSDGWYAQPPSRVPNTPQALVAELQGITGAKMTDLIENGYDLLQYRLLNELAYPKSIAPAGYTLKERYLLTIAPNGELTTLYDTPTGVDADRWSYFLHALDSRNTAKTLDEYAAYGNVIREFGQSGATALRQALRLRLGAEEKKPFAHVQKAFFELYPPRKYETEVERSIAGYRAIFETKRRF
ncbi:hypothetical protein hmeg3_13015 [Herbaspirillum sp. meg3]|uniref:hypothetical protein n=1 Tax=Herbaspirillum sp. meg3 TaxID=2025949 RepID=UPI000B990C80|nr:hypothetical protein [Herbaspirillum sp. meg3]ASU39114.1 hypothetical protein hmeg3_13015 [Herbaspirillum sp. meg3]